MLMKYNIVIIILISIAFSALGLIAPCQAAEAKGTSNNDVPASGIAVELSWIKLTGSGSYGSKLLRPAAPATKSSRADVVPEQLASVQRDIQHNAVKEADVVALATFLQQKPDDYRAHALLGDCYGAGGFTQLAEAEYLLALQTHPAPDDLLVGLVNKTFREEGLLAAERKLRALQEKLPNCSARLLLHVQLMLARGNSWGASHVCDVWERSSNNHFCLGTARAMILFDQKDYVDALAEVEKDLSSRPDFALANALKSRILSAIGRS